MAYASTGAVKPELLVGGDPVVELAGGARVDGRPVGGTTSHTLNGDAANTSISVHRSATLTFSARARTAYR